MSSGWFKKVGDGLLGECNLIVFQALLSDAVQLVIEFAIHLCTSLGKLDEGMKGCQYISLKRFIHWRFSRFKFLS